MTATQYGPRAESEARATPPARQTAITAQPVWARATSCYAGVAVGVVLATAGLLLARVDLALLALPLILAAAWTLDRRPDPTQRSSIAVELTRRPGGTGASYVIALNAPDGVETVVLRLGSLGNRPRDFLVSSKSMRRLTGSVPFLHSGPQELLRVACRLLGTDAAMIGRLPNELSAELVVPPARIALAHLPLPRRLHGLTGTHESARPGDGGEFRDIHPFTPGDQLRRIDWKTTARHGRSPGDLYVRRTAATSDVTVLIVLDSRDDIGEQTAQWRSNNPATKGISSLDFAREAASSIAGAYIRAGDRVGLHDLGGRGWVVEAGGGSKHLWRLLRAIELTRPSDMPSYHRARPPIVGSGVLIYVVSSFVDDEAARMAALWAASGHRVIAVDVLPAPRFARTTRYERTAYRIVMMERDDRIRALQAQGVDLLRWPNDASIAGDASASLETAPSREAQLRLLARPARARR